MKFFNKNKIKKPYIKFSKIEKITFAILIAIHILFTAFVVYLLQTPMDDWIYNLGQYNNQLLELFPKAQNWVNNSPAFREKLILIYATYRPLLWFMLVVMVVVMSVQYKRYTNPEIISIDNRCLENPKSLKKMIFGILFIGLVFYVVFFSLGQGSEVVKSFAELDYSGIANEFRKYNTIIGIYIYRIMVGTLMSTIIVSTVFIGIYKIIFCLKQRRINDNIKH
jgi:cell division protein FtsL